MKSVLLLCVLLLIAGCDPFNFGFKKNPAFALEQSFKAVVNLDRQTYLEVTGKEALCVYGNEEGINYLKNNLVLNTENIKLKPIVLKKAHHLKAKYVGYWSYYSERYQVDIQDKTTENLMLKTYIDCEFGTDEEKSDGLVNLEPPKYPVKECRVVKGVPEIFAPLEIPSRCKKLEVIL